MNRRSFLKVITAMAVVATVPLSPKVLNGYPVKAQKVNVQPPVKFRNYSDPLGQRADAGWKMWMSSKILNDSHVVLLATACA